MDDDEPGDDVEPAETEGQRQARGVVEGLAVALLGVGVSLAVPGAGGAVLGAATGSLLPAWEIVRQRARGRVERTVEDGVAHAGLTADGFTAWVAADPRHQGLLLAVVEAAARSTAEAHLDALARVLAGGARDDARLDAVTLIARAWGDFTPAHVQVLRTLSSHRLAQEGHPGLPQWSNFDLYRDLAHLAEALGALLASLEAQGCCLSRQGVHTDDGQLYVYEITPFGEACMGFLDGRARDRDDPSQRH